jgi:hypothetical protein
MDYDPECSCDICRERGKRYAYNLGVLAALDAIEAEWRRTDIDPDARYGLTHAAGTVRKLIKVTP